MRVEQKANYKLVVETNTYAGNYERELIAYALGTLDSVALEEVGGFEEEIESFWQEEFQCEPKDSELKEKYLMETYQEVDDWEQLIFYRIEHQNNLIIQLVQPLNDFWEEIVIRRIQKFFTDRPFADACYMREDAKVLGIYLTDSNGNIIKRYL